MRVKAGLLGLVVLLGGALSAARADWPREMKTGEGRVVMYQPQIEKFEGTQLEARSAVSVTLDDGKPVFGAVWIECLVETDRDARIVNVLEVSVTSVRFPDASEDQTRQLATFLEREIPRWQLTFALDRLIADLDNSQRGFSTPGIKSTAPVIILSREPAILVVLDGEPVWQEMEDVGDADIERVVNTPFLIVRETASRTYYLPGGGPLWYSAREVTGPWELTTSVPNTLKGLVTEEPGAGETEGGPPKIIVATEPTELVVSAGEPSWSPVEGMNLLYMDNTDSDVFLEIASQSYFVLLSGRWYRGSSVDDVMQWVNVPNDEIPEAFSDIPPDSTNGNVLSQVAGTEQAREAALDNSIPQTTAVRRDAASFDVSYDGEPAFEPVEDVEGLQYAANTASPVFLVAGRYYACEEGVWYESATSNGPWAVATQVPESIYFIPASNPHHNVTYVKIYESTPEVVYVGYTPGYTGSYYYGGCVVYGTGWYYHPWYHGYYYPRPATWGFRVSYNPWTGWGFGVTWSRGPFTIGIGSWGHGHRHGWFGVGGYRPYPRPYVGASFRKTNVNININVNNPGGNRPGGNRPGGNRPSGGNIYDRPQNHDRNAARPSTGNRQQPTTANGPNNVLTDRDGNVYRRDDKGGWQQRDQGQWKNAENLDRGSGGRAPSTGSSRPGSSSAGRGSGPATRPQLERDQHARQRGNQRSNNFQGSSRSSPSRGGGGRRR